MRAVPHPCLRTALAVRPRAFGAGIACLLGALAGAPGCDGSARPIDAQTQPSASSAELVVRFDLSAGKQASVSVLGFRAATAGAENADVLGLVDPLAAAAPDQGCLVRDADLTTRVFADRGGSVDLEELPGMGVALGSEGNVIHPFPRVFPDVAGVVAGVVAEAGPQAVTSMPERVTLYSPDSELPVGDISVPALPRLTSLNGAAPVAGARIVATEGLTLTLAGAAGALVELRPFGATVAITCAVPAAAGAESVLTVPRAMVARLPFRADTVSIETAPTAAGTSAVAVSLEVVRRTRARAAVGPTPARVSVEVRAALPVELRR